MNYVDGIKDKIFTKIYCNDLNKKIKTYFISASTSLFCLLTLFTLCPVNYLKMHKKINELKIKNCFRIKIF